MAPHIKKVNKNREGNGKYRQRMWVAGDKISSTQTVHRIIRSICSKGKDYCKLLKYPMCICDNRYFYIFRCTWFTHTYMEHGRWMDVHIHIVTLG